MWQYLQVLQFTGLLGVFRSTPNHSFSIKIAIIHPSGDQMPIYEYQCQDCGYKFDALRSIKDADTTLLCKKCQSAQTVRLLSTCFSHSDSHSADASGATGCGGCSGGSCASCGH
jgi:putative FmdB family regulatory protein